MTPTPVESSCAYAKKKWRNLEMPKLSQAKIDKWKKKHAQITPNPYGTGWANEAITKEEILRSR